MASEDDSKRKCFTFFWKLENASYCWQSQFECIESPLFTVDEIHETNWRLELFPSIRGNNNLGFCLRKLADDKCAESVKIEYELALLSLEGTVLHAMEKKTLIIGKGDCSGPSIFALRNEVFLTKRSVFFPHDTLTTRCRMWKSAGEMSKDVQCFARTIIVVEKRSFLLNIEHFSTLKSYGKKTFEIKSNDNCETFMTLELFLTGGKICDETIRFKVIPNYQRIKISTFQLFIVDTSKNIVKCFQDEFWYRDPCCSKDFILFCTKSKLLEKKSTYLPNDVLSLWCECAFSFGTVLKEIDMVDFDSIAVAKNKSDNRSAVKENEFSVPKCILLDNLKSMLNNSCVSDVKLRTKSQTYPSHMFILTARSPVFKALFLNDMKEKINECVDIEDLNDDTVLRMLHYIYSAEVEELDWSSATELYVAADKYQILNLRDICSSFLKRNLFLNNACEALVLADLHLDEDLKGFVLDFVLRHGKDIINSKEWKQFAETNQTLSFETIGFKFEK